MSEKMEEIHDIEQYTETEVSGLAQEEDILKKIREQIAKVSRSIDKHV